jgi:hypothetical protein
MAKDWKVQDYPTTPGRRPGLGAGHHHLPKGIDAANLKPRMRQRQSDEHRGLGTNSMMTENLLITTYWNIRQDNHFIHLRRLA